MDLDQAKLLVTFVLQDFAEQPHLVVLLLERIHRIQDRL